MSEITEARRIWDAAFAAWDSGRNGFAPDGDHEGAAQIVALAMSAVKPVEGGAVERVQEIIETYFTAPYETNWPMVVNELAAALSQQPGNQCQCIDCFGNQPTHDADCAYMLETFGPQPDKDEVVERVGPDEFYGAVGVAMFKADLGGLPINQKINFVGNAAYLAMPSVKADGERA